MTIDKPSDQVPELQSCVDASQSVELLSGGELQKPDPNLISWLQSQDSRVRYFPADTEVLGYASGGVEYRKAVADPLAERVSDDFAGQTIAVRGTAAALKHDYQYKTLKGNVINTVLDILEYGSDTGSDTTRVGGISPSDDDNPARFNIETCEWLEDHMGSVAFQLGLRANEDDLRNLDQTFPVLIVYDESDFSGKPSHGWCTLQGHPSERVKAIYITDKVISRTVRENISIVAGRNEITS